MPKSGFIKNCVIENNSAKDNHTGNYIGRGGGIYENNYNANLYITDTEIVNNSADDIGGGLISEHGRIKMSGGSLSGNTARMGAGIYSFTSFEAMNVSMSNNNATENGGAAVYNDGNATLTGCAISYNNSVGDGGAICNTTNLTVKNCAINDNYTKGNGGGICSIAENDPLNLDTCIFIENVSDGCGGAVSIYGKANISNCVMKSNKAGDTGGAIDVHYRDARDYDRSSFSEVSLINGIITENESASGSGGLWVCSNMGKVSIGGDLTIKDNVGRDVTLGGEKKLVIAEPLTTNSRIGIYLDRSYGTFTEGFPDKNLGIYPSDIFTAPDGQAILADENGEARVAKSDWPALQHMIDTAGSGSTITLTRDWKASDDDVPLHISMVNSIEIDLAGHTIDRNLGSIEGDGQVFTVQGGLTIKDSVGGGKICGGWAEEGGGFYVDSGAYFTIKGGTISDNWATRGGAVYAKEGHVTIDDGTVTGNWAREGGGGIYVTGEYITGDVEMNGGTISSNTSDGNGGGIILTGKSAASINGGTISKNEATYEAGGVYCVDEGTTLSVKGSPTISDNNASIGKNILVSKDTRVTVAEKLADGAKIDVSTKDVASPITSGFQATESDLGSFTYNESANLLEARPDSATNQNELFFKRPNADVWVSDWKALQNAINDEANRGKTIGLNNDISANGEDRLYVGDKNVTVELCGYKLDRQLDDDDEDGHVFEVEGNGSSLTIKDTAGTGRITGGYAEHGGAINIHGGSTCTIEGGTVTGNRASDEGGGIFVYGTLNMTGGSIAGNKGNDCGGIYVHEDGIVTLENVNLMNNVASDHGGGAINNKGVVTLKNCLIRSNSADAEGGGLYNGKKEMTITDCTITANSAPEGGGICSFGTVTISNTKLTDNEASDIGGGAYVHGTLTMNGGEISNNAGKDCGGIYNDDGKIELTDVAIKGNKARKLGGAGVNNKGEGFLTNCTISENKAAAEGGGVYNNDDLTIDGCTIANNQAGDDGGGICSYGTLAVNDCNISSNSTKKSGGALRINGNITSISGGKISENKADENGGAIYVNNDNATLNLASSPKDTATANAGFKSTVNDPAALRITSNAAGYNGGGIFVAGDAGTVNVQGKIAVYENDGGSNIYLTPGKKLTISGELSRGTNLAVTLKDDLGSFTKNYAAFHPHDDPYDFFSSDADYQIVRNNDELEMRKWVYDPNDKQFITRGSQVIRDYNKLNSTNWMAGLSGEKYLYEINIPGTHDSGTKSLEGNISTGDISKVAAALGAVGGFIGGIFGALGGGLSLPVIISEEFEKYANCQDRYINEQLQDGIRQLDIRLNTYYAEQGYPIDNKDDDENLWILHGKDKMGGSYFAKDDDGDFLNFAKVLSWCKEFLERHPTETIIMSVQIDSVDIDDVYDDGIERIASHLRQLSQEVNPATNEPFLYMEDGVFNRVFTHYPQLKDCRGKIVINASTDDMAAGGFGGLNSGMGLTVYRPEGDFHDHADEKIAHLTAFYNEYAGRPLATDADTHIDYYYSVGTNGTDDSGMFGIPTVTPIEIAEEVLPVMFDDPGLVVNREGTYLGLVNMDREHARETGIVWKSNFFDGLQYCTVTVKSSPSDDSPKTYTVMKNTPITIPESIYDSPDTEKSFKGWKATSTSGGSTTAATSGIVYQPGARFPISEDVTFTAQWGDEKEPVNPVTPANPTQPTDPNKPSEPTTPSTPDEPGAPTPSEPTTPSAPETPNTPDEPGVPAPSAPTTPSAPENPSSSSQSSASTEPTETTSEASSASEPAPASDASTATSTPTSQSSDSPASTQSDAPDETSSSSASAAPASASSSAVQSNTSSSSQGTPPSSDAASASPAPVDNASSESPEPSSDASQSTTSASTPSTSSASSTLSTSSASAGSSASQQKKDSSESNASQANNGIPWHLIAIGAALAIALLSAAVVFLRRRNDDSDGENPSGNDPKDSQPDSQENEE